MRQAEVGWWRRGRWRKRARQYLFKTREPPPFSRTEVLGVGCHSPQSSSILPAACSKGRIDMINHEAWFLSRVL